jgi:hypothetical protein
MAIRTKRLTRRFVETVKDKGMFADGDNLYLQVGEEGRAKSWLFRYAFGGRERYMGLGPVSTFDLDEARERALQCRKLLKDGIDPQEHRKDERLDQQLAAAKQVAFGHCVDGWLAKQEKGWSPGRTAAIRRRFELHVFPHIAADLPVQRLDLDQSKDASQLVLAVLKPIWTEKYTTAEETRQHLDGVLHWAWGRDYIANPNAAAWKGKVSAVLPGRDSFYRVENHPSLPYKDAPLFMQKLRARVDQSPYMMPATRCLICSSPHCADIEAAAKQPGVTSAHFNAIAIKFAATTNLRRGSIYRHLHKHMDAEAKIRRPVGADLLEFLILTAVRKDQAVMATWDEIDEDNKVWISEQHKTKKKTGQAYIIPLTDQAMAVLKRMKKVQETEGFKSKFIFPGGRNGRKGHMSKTGLNAFLHRSLGYREITPHGFRSTFADWATDNGWPDHDSEIALGHVIGNKTRRAYKRKEMEKRIEPRRLMLQAWADFCGRGEPLPSQKTVTSFQKAKAARRSAQ